MVPLSRRGLNRHVVSAIVEHVEKEDVPSGGCAADKIWIGARKRARYNAGKRERDEKQCRREMPPEPQRHGPI